MKNTEIKVLFDAWMKSDDVSLAEIDFVKQYYDETDDLEYMAHGFYAGYCLAERHSGQCTWAQVAEGIWHTSCGQAHEFTIGTPEENKHRYCPYCGKVLEAKEYEE